MHFRKINYFSENPDRGNTGQLKSMYECLIYVKSCFNNIESIIE